MTAEQLVAAIRDLGFPVVVAGFVLWRVDRSLRALTGTITDLRLMLAEKLGAWDGCERRANRDRDLPPGARLP